MEQRLYIIVIFLLELFWFIMLIHLMTRRNSVFPGKNDKTLWVVILLVTNVIGAFAFLITIPFLEAAKKDRLRIIPEDIQASSDDVTLQENEYQESCLKCGKPFPPDATQCPSCGWSYQNNK